MSAPALVHHQAEGPEDAPVVVLSPSLGSTLAMWAPQATALARSFRVVRYDLRGHGRSPVPPGPYEIADLGGDLIGLLDRLAIPRAHLGGISLGGMASLWVAAHHPERVDRLVVCCTSAKLGPPEMWAERAVTVEAHGTGVVADAVVGRWFTTGFRARHPGLVAELVAMVAATSTAGYAACCRAIQRMDLGPDLGAIRAPTLAIAGADDPAIPPAHLHRIGEGVAGCRVVVVGDGAHLLNVEQPEQVTRLMLGHLQGPPHLEGEAP